MEVFLECCMTLFFSAAMLLLIVRLAKGEEKNMMFARVFSLASNVGFWIGIVRIAVLNLIRVPEAPRSALLPPRSGAAAG